jgi:metallo-beta-lactamase family protein
LKLQFLGANRQVTGSCYCLEAGDARVLIDCGMFQEREYLDRNWEEFAVAPRDLNAVILTHAHIDHSGLLPKLVHDGFRGPILCTPATDDLAGLILRDSAEIQAEDAAFKRKRHHKEGRTAKHPEAPLYTIQDVDRTLPRIEGIPYGQTFGLCGPIRVTLHDAGHILGSAIVDLEIDSPGGTRRLVFSGDLGQWDKPILRDPTLIERADYVVMESTYGDRDHDGGPDVEQRLAEVICETLDRGGNLVMPTFAVERAQEIMYHMGRLTEARRIPRVSVYLDSPMAVDATGIFERHRDCYDAQAWELIHSGHHPLRFPGLKLVRTREESMKINTSRGPSIIMAPSGMCTAGRIKHHLAHNINRPDCTVLFTGYQGRGTLGRQILEGSREVRIHGREWAVRAKIEEIHGFSGHADRAALLRWLGGFKSPPRRLFLTHGEQEAKRRAGRSTCPNTGRPWNSNRGLS